MISPFEYVAVLISIILGLGITQILTGIADLFHKSEKVKLYWPHTLWMLLVLFLHVQEWWVMYELKDFTQWRLPTFLFIMLYPINLFLLARMLFPTSLKGKVIDLKVFYLKKYRKLFILFILLGVLSVLYNVLILNLSILTQSIQGLIILCFVGITIKENQQEWIHKSLAVIITLIMVVSILIEWDVWLIN